MSTSDANKKGLFGIMWGKTCLTTEHTEITENFKRLFSVDSVISVVKKQKTPPNTSYSKKVTAHG